MTRLPVRPYRRLAVIAALPAAGLAVALTGQAAVAAPAGAVAPAVAGGTVLAWGENANGQLGNGGTAGTDKPVTVALPAGTKITSVASGGRHSLAVTSTGKVLAWGDNHFGQLGDGNNTDSRSPVLVHLPAGTKVKAVAAGGTDSLALTSTGHVLAWGDDHYGQLGDGSTVARNTPAMVRMPKGTRVVSLGASYNCSLAVTASGFVWAWGYNGSGQLGNGFHTASEIPVRVHLPSGVRIKSLVSSGYDGLALTRSGRLVSWGDNSKGQLGDGTKISSTTPVMVRLAAGVRVVAIGAGSQHSVALTSTGQVLAWGYNEFGQLGNGTRINSDVPVAVHIPAGVKVIAVSAGGGYSLALTSTGQVLAWGHNEDGQLGDGARISTKTPVRVHLPAGLTAIALAAGPTTRHNLIIAR